MIIQLGIKQVFYDVEYYLLHLFISGHYIWLNNSDTLEAGAAGYLKTSSLSLADPDQVYCLSFYYYQFGDSFIGSQLSVLALKDGNETAVANIWPIIPINYTYINNRW